MENLNNVTIVTNETVNENSNETVNAANETVSEVSNGLEVATQHNKPKVLHLSIPQKLTPKFDAENYLMKGLPIEMKQNIYKMVDLAERKAKPSFDNGTVSVLVVFENVWNESKTITQTTNEYVKDVKRVALPILKKDENGEVLKDENGNVITLEENLVKTGHKDDLGRETFFVRSTDIVKGWKQVRTTLGKTEQLSTKYYPYTFLVPENRLNDFSYILGCAIKLHEKYLKRLVAEKDNSFKYSGTTHVTFNLQGTSISTKLVSDNGIKSRLIKDDFKSFCRSIYLRLSEAISMMTETTNTVDIDKMFN